ncbi:hypothetical protein, partial [Hominibacterium faecale]|uniref:hypothetical protein n=1 Tax=Hominibacterium faecale TaxID=2839743 RepID=UPI0022B2A845
MISFAFGPGNGVTIFGNASLNILFPPLSFLVNSAVQADSLIIHLLLLSYKNRAIVKNSTHNFCRKPAEIVEIYTPAKFNFSEYWRILQFLP